MRDSQGGDSHTWATWVRSAREAAGLSQAELATQMGVSRNTISRWEIGAYTPDTVAVAVSLARVTGVDIDDTLAAAGFRPGGTPPEPEPPLSHRLRQLRDLLADPEVSDDDKRLIEAQLDHLATMARRLRGSPRGD